MLLMLFDIHFNGKNNFPSHLMNMSEYADLTFSSNQALAKEFFQRCRVKESLMRALFKSLCVNTCSTVSHDFFLLQHLKIHIRLTLSTAFNFVSNYTVGCISWQRNRKENFVNGDQMPKWRLFMDWWAERQRGKNPKQKLYPRHRVDSIRVKHDHFQVE